MNTGSQLIDQFGRKVKYLRLSVTDRCDFRCTYCMAEDMQFLPRQEILTLEEIHKVARTFVELGVGKIRITGGEPLIRKNIIELLSELGKEPDLQELCLTTNASHLEQYADDLKKAGVHSLNISLDSLRADRFNALTRYGKLDAVLRGIDAAREAAFKRIKINSVVLKNYNLDECADLVEYALSRDLDISFIEEMPLGEIHSHARNIEFVSSDELRKLLSSQFSLSPTNDDTLGPSKYWQAKGFRGRVGFISPHSHNFCASCNRVRVTASGRLLLCLGNEHSLDLRHILRSNEKDHDNTELKQAIVNAMAIKPEKHEFNLEEAPQVLRFMNATGG